jgi:FkbM family methyltransferase
MTFNKVVAFEPAPATYDRLSNNIQLNRLDHVTAERKALGENPGSAKLFVLSNRPGENSLYAQQESLASQEETSREQTIVKITSLDEYAKEHNLGNVDFIKIDVEGHEIPLLKGALKTIGDWHPSIYAEIHEDRKVIDFHAQLPKGYVCYDPMSGNPLDIHSHAASRDRSRDLLFKYDPIIT